MSDGRSIHHLPVFAVPRAAYVLLDGQAGRTKLFGRVVDETRRYYVFVPDRDCYRFHKGIRRRVLKQHVRFQQVELEEGDA